MKIESASNSLSPLFLAIYFGLAALNVAIVCFARLLPFVDLPDQLAIATIFRGFAEPANAFLSHYFLESVRLRPNVAHLFITGSSVFPSVEIANKFYYLLYIALFATSVLLVIRRLRANVWFALLAYPFLINFSVIWGFTGYTLAIPLILLLVWLMIRLDESNRWADRCLIGALFFALFFVHVLALLFCYLFFAALSAVRARSSPLCAVKDWIAIGPSIALVALWWVSQGSGGETLGYALGYYTSLEYFTSLARRAANIAVYDNFHMFAGLAGIGFGAFVSLIILAPLVLGARRHRANLRSLLGAPGARVALIFFLTAAACCALLPDSIPAHRYITTRYIVLLWLSVVFLGGILWTEGLGARWPMAICMFALAHQALWAHYVVDFNRRNAGFTREFLPAGGDDATLYGLIYDHTFRGRPIYIHFPSYFTVWNEGIAGASLIDSRFGIVRRMGSLDSMPVYNPWVSTDHNYRNEYDGADYLLVSGDVPTPDVFLKNYEELRRHGLWTLYQRKSEAP